MRSNPVKVEQFGEFYFLKMFFISLNKTVNNKITIYGCDTKNTCKYKTAEFSAKAR